ncbi:unnamed protein product [Clavelina lepadiformis]|uniref:Uncharacterized protein n=1 Tax=Clavelina lepadiformis TaxID=159417 RepID=A0ABP0GPJ6_CLALP
MNEHQCCNGQEMLTRPEVEQAKKNVQVQRESKLSSCAFCAAGPRFGDQGMLLHTSRGPNPAASSRDLEAVLGYHGDAGFCDYYERA